METYFKELALKLNIQLSEKQLKEFFQYKDFLIETNKHINLTAIVEDKEIILKHFIDSLTIYQYIENGKNLIDVGTGAGFPGIPLKIVSDELDVTLLDSLNKRVNFLNDVINQLDLKKISAMHGRAEDIARLEQYREKFDYVTARAVANLATLAEFCIPFLKVGGTFICMKANIKDEVENAKSAIKILGGEITSIEKFYLPDSEIERNIILIKKVNNTPSKYPRKAGLPGKEPLQ